MRRELCSGLAGGVRRCAATASGSGGALLRQELLFSTLHVANGSNRSGEVREETRFGATRIMVNSDPIESPTRMLSSSVLVLLMLLSRIPLASGYDYSSGASVAGYRAHDYGSSDSAGGYSLLFCWFGIEELSTSVSKSRHVILANPSPILFYPISSTEIRCLVDIPGQKLPSLASGNMAKYLKKNCGSPGNIRTMPNKIMPAAPHLLMGDAFNMRHPLTGGGMTVALSDIVVLRNFLRPLRNLKDADSLCKYLESFYTLCKPVASTINTLAGALYEVFCASSDQARMEMCQACFSYLSIGGVCSKGPIALLSGLNPRPLSFSASFVCCRYI
ncbi:hypothetical protein BUALT_Bualt11G0065400 [Buddleja alternifolia]|uniref:Squalene monooxygenase n=1 Tax=Buddleja alternifolia TaxID=168488 RepID=A0AAV6WUR8_9LAMI|nr:hypothetical protein BUALT_Bualt11G0065400 [Buddleja alternifolia]